jgi:hypothetical protein
VLAFLRGYYTRADRSALINHENRGDRRDCCGREGAFEPIITLSDSDVLFKAGWLDAIETVMATFPGAGWRPSCRIPEQLASHLRRARRVSRRRTDGRQGGVGRASIDSASASACRWVKRNSACS